jgi:hypothetical protein
MWSLAEATHWLIHLPVLGFVLIVLPVVIIAIAAGFLLVALAVNR